MNIPTEASTYNTLFRQNLCQNDQRHHQTYSQQPHVTQVSDDEAVMFTQFLFGDNFRRVRQNVSHYAGIHFIVILAFTYRLSSRDAAAASAGSGIGTRTGRGRFRPRRSSRLFFLNATFSLAASTVESFLWDVGVTVTTATA